MSRQDFVRIYTSTSPRLPTPEFLFDQTERDYAFLVWITVLSMAGLAAVIICLCLLYWKLHPSRHSGRRSSTNAALVPPAGRAVVTFRAGRGSGAGHGGHGYSTTGVLNIAFENDVHDGPHSPEDGPPTYTAVAESSSAVDKSSGPQYPAVTTLSVIETPPPTYTSIAPPF